MTQLNYLSQTNPLGPDNRKTMLLVWGILMILMGSMAGCFALATPLMLAVPGVAAAGGMRIGQVLMTVGIYGIMAVALIWTGIGSIRCHRWVRPIVLVFSTMWLVIGVLATTVTLFSLPAMQQAATTAPAGAGAAPAAAPFGIFVGMVGCISLLFIALPAVLIWSYRSPAVRATLEFYDPQPRWTDQLPLPVLGLSMGLALAGLGMLTFMAGGTVMAFSFVITGAPAILIAMLVSGALFLAAWLTLRRRVAGWWLAMMLIVLFTTSLVWSWVTVDLDALYTAMDVPEAQREQIVAMVRRQRPMQLIGTSLLGLGALGYTIYARRWFDGSRALHVR